MSTKSEAHFLTKGDEAFYSSDNRVVRARVKSVHRDGSVSLIALFFQEDGKDVPGYLGYVVRLLREELRA